MKKMTAVLALSMALTFAFAGCSDSKGTGTGGNAKENQLHNSFIDEIGGVSETYKGAISSNSYSTKEAAAEAFVTEELAGDSNVNIINTTSKQEYYGPAAVQNVITQQKLPIEDTSDIVSIEQMEVTYSVDSGDTYVSPMAMASNSNKKVTVYVIKYSTHWEYYSPAPTTGSTITKSYYDSVFNSDAWKNCTYDMTMTMDMNMNVSGYVQGVSISENVQMTMTMSQFAQYQEDKLYLEQTATMSISGSDLLMEELGEMNNISKNSYAYIETDELGNMLIYVKADETNMEWINDNLETIGFNTIEDLTPFAGDNYLDYTYFTKTNYGFELSGDNAKQYINETLADMGEMGMVSAYLEQMQLDMFCKYYVSNGVLSGMREDATMSMNMSESGMGMKMNATIVAEASVKNYGSTVVQKPADIVG